MSPARRCWAKGLLVSAAHFVPDHPAEHDASGSIVPAVGCNQLRCGECQAAVRVFVGFHLPPQHETDLAALYEAGDPRAFPEVTAAPDTRLYACRCRAHAEHTTRFVEDFDELRVLSLPWACAGHPAFAFPGALDGTTLSLDEPLDPLVAALLAARLPAAIHPAIRDQAGFQAVRVHRLLDDPEARRRFGACVGRHLADEDAAVRRGALGFYRLEPRAEGVGELLERRHDKALWSAADPVAPGATLAHTLKLALAAIERAG